MVEMLKNMRAYLIYKGLFYLVMAAGYFLEPGRFVGQDCDWSWRWMMVAICVLLFEVFLSGPAFALFYQMYQFTVKEIFWSALMILGTTFLPLSVVELLLSGGAGMWIQGVLYILGGSLWISGTYTVAYFILRSICKKTRMG